MFKIIYVSILVIFCGSLYGQTAKISGKITDATSHDPVPFATVKITNPLKGVEADESGN